MKARVIQMRGPGAKVARLHLAYIERDGVERVGSEGRLYGPAEGVDRASLSGAISGERHRWACACSGGR